MAKTVTKETLTGTHQFREESISIENAIRVLQRAKSNGYDSFYPVIVDGVFNYKTSDCDPNLKLIFLNK
tara:strand:+ start:7921 stop:8127 length:207 start_codon:yes stop_codon:yes gene_type:complete